MEVIRQFAKSKLGQFSMLLVLAPMAFLGLNIGGGSNASADEVVKVGDKSIGATELQSLINDQRAQLIADGVDVSLIKEDVLKKQVLTNLINRNLLEQQTGKLGLTVSDKVITEQLKTYPAFKGADGNFSNDMFAQALQRNGMTKDQLFAQRRTQLALEQLSSGIVSTSIYPMSAINQLIDLQLESRNIWLYRLAWQDFENKVSVSDTEIQDYYDQNQTELNSIPMVDVSYVELTLDAINVPEPTQEEIAEQYEIFKTENNFNDMRQFSQILLTGDDAKSKAQEIKTKLSEGADFAKLAKKHSDDPSGATGGDMGRFVPAMFGSDAPQVESALAKLKVGDVSEPVKTSFGYQVFTVTEDQSEDIPTLDSVKDKLTKRIADNKRQQLLTDKITQINEMAADGYGLQDIAEQEGLNVKTIDNYQKDENTSVLSQPKVIDSAFNEFTIQDQSVTSGIDVANGTVWLQSNNYRPVKTLTIKEAEPKIRSVLTKQKATALALKKAEKIASMVNSKDDINQQEVKFITLNQITRENPILIEGEKSLAFSKEAQKDGVVTMAVQTKRGASVIVADEIKTSQEAQISDAEKQQVASTIRNNFGQDQLLDYLDYLNTVAQVEIKQEKLDTLEKN